MINRSNALAALISGAMIALIVTLPSDPQVVETALVSIGSE